MKHNESSQDRSAKIGLFGGTFNPVHHGHLTAARDVQEQLNLDRLYFVPSALPPHKSNDPLVPAQQRLEMVRLAVGESNQFCVCDIEIQRTGPSYSIDTVRQFRANIPAGGQLYFVLGMDAFLEIHTWRTFEALFDEAACAVMSRPGTGQWTPSMRGYIQDYVASHISSAYRLSDKRDRLTHSRKKTIYLVSVTPVDISSSRLRAMIQAQQPIDAWVCPSVARYIETRGLYR